jgi:hypothetical protein
MRKMARFIATSVNSLLQPGNSLVELAEFDHVRPNVVIWIAEIGVEFDGAFAFGNRIHQFALEVIRPA